MCGWSVNQATEVLRWKQLFTYHITVFIYLHLALPHLVTSTVHEYSDIRYSMQHICMYIAAIVVAITRTTLTSGLLGIWLCVLLVCSAAEAYKAEAEIIINCNAYVFMYICLCMFECMCELLYIWRKTKRIHLRIKFVGIIYICTYLCIIKIKIFVTML